MTIATAWEALARQEREAHRRRWGQYQEKKEPKPKKKTGRPLGTYNPERLEQIRQLVHMKRTNADIARIIGVSESSIRYWKAKYNLR